MHPHPTPPHPTIHFSIQVFTNKLNKTVSLRVQPTTPTHAQRDQWGRTKTNDCGCCAIDQHLARRWRRESCCVFGHSAVSVCCAYWQGLPPRSRPIRLLVHHPLTGSLFFMEGQLIFLSRDWFVLSQTRSYSLWDEWFGLFFGGVFVGPAH